MQVLRETLEKMLVHSKQYTDVIDQDVFVSELQQNIQENGVGQRFLAGYVNFCTLMPMRSIPFKMVCLLGMNDVDYPRQSVPMGFDLMRIAPVKRGDRSRRLDDRYLFLEALLSAREQLYFSYQGFSQKDNSPLAPSILLSELLEYCQQGFCLSGQVVVEAKETEQNLLDHLTIKHKLQPVDQAYFVANRSDGGQQSHISFNQKQQAIAEQVKQPSIDLLFNSESLDTPVEQASYVELNDLIQFFQNPAKAFFIHRWQTRFYPLGQQNSDEEPFSFDGLDRYQVNERLVKNALELNIHASVNEAESEALTVIQHAQCQPEKQLDNSQALLNELRAEGKLPAGQTGELTLRPLDKQSAQLAGQIMQLNLSDSPENSVDIELLIEGVTLQGRIDNLYGQKLILWRTGKLRAKDRIALYLQWLCLCAYDNKSSLNQAHFISTEKPYSLPLVEKQQAIELLGPWLKYWQLGGIQLLHFYPESAWQWVNTQDLSKTISTFKGNDFAAGEGTEDHIQRVCPDLLANFETFSQVSDELLLPIVELGANK
jgi:exodeoxyribonuclease V gamma subunit